MNSYINAHTSANIANDCYKITLSLNANKTA